MQPQRTIIHVTDRLTFYEENITFKELSEYISKTLSTNRMQNLSALNPHCSIMIISA